MNCCLYICAYEVHLIVDLFYEKAFLHRTEKTDELWTGVWDSSWALGIDGETASAEDFEGRKLSGIGCRFAVEKKGDELTASLRLMEVMFRVIHGGPESYEGFVAPGILDKAAYDGLVGRLEAEYEGNRRKARENEIELIKVARELGLAPFPTGKYPDQWQAHCPGKNHPIYITTTENYFFCGWCRRKGGINELRELVKERKK